MKNITSIEDDPMQEAITCSGMTGKLATGIQDITLIPPGKNNIPDDHGSHIPFRQKLNNKYL